MTPQRFCLLTTFYPPSSFGGDAIAVQRLARALAGRGHHVVVIHDADAHSVQAGFRADPISPDPWGVRVVTLRSRLPLLSTILTHQTGRPVVNGSRLRRLLADGAFDVILFHNISLLGGPALLGYGGGAVTLYFAHEHWLVCPTHVLWRHGLECCDGRQCLRCQWRYRRPPQLWRATGLLERHLEEVDCFVAMSEFSRAKHREFGFPREMEVLPHFLPDPGDPADRSGAVPHQRPYFFVAGRLERLKGLDEVIGVVRDRAGADLLVAGEGTEGERLRRLAGDSARIRFLGRVDPDAMRTYYRHALAVIAPSRGFETFGLTLIEAFSQGTPVIARRIGPFPEIVAQAGGDLLFETTADLRAALDIVEGDAERRHALGRAGYEAFQRHWSEHAALPRYFDVIDRARARRRARETVCAPS